MRKIISFMHLSLDGFVAGPNGEMDWIKMDDELFHHVGKRISKGDTALYGRVTYELMQSYWPTAADSPTASQHTIDHSRWYASVRKVVLSKTMKADGSSAGQGSLGNLKIISDNLSEEITKLKHSGSEDILIFGSPEATHSLMKLNLIDGYWLFVNPIVLGKGIPLFVDNQNKTKLKLVTTQPFASGVVELNYVVD